MNRKFVLKQYAKMGMQNLFLPVVYRIYKRKKVDKNCVVFADAHHSEVPFSMRYLLAQLQKTDKRVITIFSDYAGDSIWRNLRQMLRFMKAYANAGYVILCDNFLPAASCKKRRETTVIQLWHACGALKKFGYDAPEDIPGYYRGNVWKNCDIVTVSSKQCIPYFASAMRLPKERIFPVGVSRTDLYYQKAFCDEVRKRFFCAYPQMENKKIVLWAPTFRGNAGQGSLCGEAAIDHLALQLGETWELIKAPHPHLLPKEQRTGSFSTEELLVVTDLLITDYSSILFDYLLLHRPLVRFAPDLAQYEEKRGFYMDYGALAGTLVVREEDLYGAVIKEAGQAEKAVDFDARLYLDACDGKATERIMRMIQ